jgi:hypothetical protein
VYFGVAVSYSLGGVFGGAFAPLIAGQLLASTGSSWSIYLFILAMAAVSFVCISLLSETYLTDLAENRAEERRLITEARESTAGWSEILARNSALGRGVRGLTECCGAGGVRSSRGLKGRDERWRG